MRALSIQQPWAWLIVNGHKDVENRSWPTNVTGDVLIHAGQKFDRLGYDYVADEFPEIPMPLPSEFARGGIVGSVEVTGCVNQSESPWFSGPYGFTLGNARPLPFIPMRGQLGFFAVPTPPPPTGATE